MGGGKGGTARSRRGNREERDGGKQGERGRKSQLKVISMKKATLFVLFFLNVFLVKDLCQLNQCANNGVCLSNGESFHCQCSVGFKGKSCKGEM